MSSSIVKRVAIAPGLTAGELNLAACGEKITTTRWALYNEERRGNVFKNGTKRCSVSGRTAAAWFPVQHTHSNA